MSKHCSYALCFSKQQIDDVLSYLAHLTGSEITPVPYNECDLIDCLSLPCAIDAVVAQYFSAEDLARMKMETGKISIGCIWLTIYENKSCFLFKFSSPSQQMNVLFEKSEAFHQIFHDILTQCHGIYGILDGVKADYVVWFKGQRCFVPIETIFVDSDDSDIDIDFVSADEVERIIADQLNRG